MDSDEQTRLTIKFLCFCLYMMLVGLEVESERRGRFLQGLTSVGFLLFTGCVCVQAVDAAARMQNPANTRETPENQRSSSQPAKRDERECNGYLCYTLSIASLLLPSSFRASPSLAASSTWASMSAISASSSLFLTLYTSSSCFLHINTTGGRYSWQSHLSAHLGVKHIFY